MKSPKPPVALAAAAMLMSGLVAPSVRERAVRSWR